MITELGLALIAVLVLLAAFCSAAGAAFTAASRVRIAEMEKRGSWRAARVLGLAEGRERLVGTLFFMGTIANIAATALAVLLFTDQFGLIGAAYAAGAMAVVILVFAEVLPRTLAIIHADRFALTVAPVVRAMVAVLGPVVMGIEAGTKRVLALFRLDTSRAQSVLSAHDELRGAIDLHLKEGAVVKKDRDMLGGILDLKELELHGVMVHRTKMTMVDAAEKPGAIIAEALKSGHSRIPVYRDKPDNIVGILHAKDLLAALHEGGDEEKIDISGLLKEPWFVPDTRRAADQLAAFLRQKKHFALVVDEYGEVMGLVTLEDILEEIVGDIADEHDAISSRVRRQKDGSLIVDGAAPIRDLNRALDWELPDHEATTIAGLIIHEARMIPDAGQAFTFHGFRFEVLRKRRHQVTAVRITKVG